MYKIFINSSERHEKSVTLLEIINGTESELITRKGDLDITQTIKEMLLETNLKPSDIDEYVSFPGPGSFTGLKIGATIANVLNWALGKKKVSDLKYPEYFGEPNIEKSHL